MFVLLMPLLALLQNIHIRVLLVLIWFPVFDLLEHAIFIPLKGAGSGGVQQRNDVGIVIADRVQLVDPGVVRVVHVLVALITGGKAPAAVPAFERDENGVFQLIKDWKPDEDEEDPDMRCV